MLSGAEATAVQEDQEKLMQAEAIETAQRERLSESEKAILRALRQSWSTWMADPIACWLMLLSLCLLSAAVRGVVWRTEPSVAGSWPDMSSNDHWTLGEWTLSSRAHVSDSDDALCNLAALGLLALALAISTDQRSQALGMLAFAVWSLMQLFVLLASPQLLPPRRHEWLFFAHAAALVSAVVCSIGATPRRKLAVTLVAAAAALALAGLAWPLMSARLEAQAAAAQATAAAEARARMSSTAPRTLGRMILLAVAVAVVAYVYAAGVGIKTEMLSKVPWDSQDGQASPGARRPSAQWKRRQTTPRLRRKHTAYPND